MSDERIRGPLSFFTVPIGDEIDKYQRLPADKKTLAHVSLAACLLAWCGYLAPVVFELAPLRTLTENWIPFAVWAFVTLVAVLWLLAAIREAQAPRNFGAALWRLLLGGAVACLLWYRVYPDWGPLAEFLIKGTYIGWLVSHVARFLVAAQLIGGGSAERRIKKILKQRNATLQASRARGFFS
jgi:hypothetical protein